ncbi:MULTISPECIES: hypothetical protein [Nguyenibacter]|uniref:Uncharacterized protein n=1 Tax=Nguyenibacter vanlangensis TaxID=1216886 RepID=A0A7Y7M7U3_9PROT|nr:MULTISPECIES: hypothetical protein [Nguyenibacter]NVN12221.1 hypothetical protein [Nguyenibacter vanlangensis]WRH89337.1 hypothetical protein QN315_06975 [Nguyenibacter sp. L1]
MFHLNVHGPKPPARPAHDLGYWTVMVVGLALVLALYATVLLFGQAW